MGILYNPNNNNNTFIEGNIRECCLIDSEIYQIYSIYFYCIDSIASTVAALYYRALYYRAVTEDIGR